MGAKARTPARVGTIPAGSEGAARRFGFVAQRGAELGLTALKTSRIAGRVNPELVRLAKERTGVVSDSELLELALTSLLLEDGFADAFREARGSVEEDVGVGL